MNRNNDHDHDSHHLHGYDPDHDYDLDVCTMVVVIATTTRRQRPRPRQVMKHFGLNQQETNRDFVSSDISDTRTTFEVYYQPYMGAIEAGVAAAMCSYNFVNGRWIWHVI